MLRRAGPVERALQGLELPFVAPPQRDRGGIERPAHLRGARRLHRSLGLVEAEAGLRPGQAAVVYSGEEVLGSGLISDTRLALSEEFRSLHHALA